MQRIVMNRSLLAELGRCDRSFVMSLFHKELDNAHLSGKIGGYDTSISDVQMEMVRNIETIQRVAAETGGVQKIVCSTNDVFEKVDMTLDALNMGCPCVIEDGALEANWLIVPFSLLVVREDLMWEVYYITAKGFMKGATKTAQKALDRALNDAGPLMKVLADGYADRVAAFYVIGIDGRYMTPYPDSMTGEIHHTDADALYRLDFDLNDGTIRDYIEGIDPIQDIMRIQEQLSYDPFWIPDAYMGSQCNKPYPCPFSKYCESQKPPSSVHFHMPSNDARRLQEAGIETMEELLELSYDNPMLVGIEMQSGQIFDVSEIGMRELRTYETMLMEKGKVE